MTLSIKTISTSLTIDTHFARGANAFPVNLTGAAWQSFITDTSGTGHDFVLKTNSTVNPWIADDQSFNSATHWDLFGPSTNVYYKISEMTGLHTGGPQIGAAMTEFVVDNTAHDDSTYFNFYNSDVMTDGDSGEIVFQGSKPQNWGHLYLGVAYQDMNSTNSGSNHSALQSDTLASANYQVFLDFDDYPEYSTDLARRFHSYTYTTYSASNEMGFRYSRSGNVITVESFNPSDGSAIYNRTVTVDPAQDARIFLVSTPSSSLVGGTYSVISQSGAPVIRDTAAGFVSLANTDLTPTYEVPTNMPTLTGMHSMVEHNLMPLTVKASADSARTKSDSVTVNMFIKNEADVMFLNDDGVGKFEQVTQFNDPIPPSDSTTSTENTGGGGSSGPVQTWF